MQEVKKSFWDILTITGSTLISLPLLIISESIQARILGPEDYGKLTLILSVISLAFLFGISWLQNAILRFGKEEFTQNNKFNTSFTSISLITIAALILTSVLIFLVRNKIFEFLEIETPQAIWIIIIGVWLLTIKTFALEILKIIRLLKVQAILFRVVSKLIILLGMLLLIYVLVIFNISSLIIVVIFSDLLIFLFAIFYLKRKYITPLILNKTQIRNILIYSFPLIFLSWSSYVINWIDAYTIKYFLSLEHVGIYQAAYKILSTLKSFFGVGLVTVFTPIIMVFVTNKEFSKISDNYIERVIPQICFLTMIVVFIIIACSDFTLNLIYGDKFRDSILPFKILATSLSFSVISYSLVPVFTSFDMTRALLILGLYAGVVNIAADILLVPIFGITGAAIASLVVFSSHSLGSIYLMRKRISTISFYSFIYPLLVLPICLIYIIPIGFLNQLLISSVVVIISVYIARKTSLVKMEDMQILQRIDMPGWFKIFMFKIAKIMTPTDH